MNACRKLATGLYLVAIPLFSFGQQDSARAGRKTEKWFPKYDFNTAAFQQPATAFAPFARWWWPGNAVTKEELKREIKLFVDHHFGGVEIQPLNLFIPGSKEHREKVVSWDTPDYYENVRTVMEEARKHGLTVDMTDGSGWPPGGPHLSAADGFLNLQFAAINITGDNMMPILLPAIANTTGVPSQLAAVLATKIFAKRPDDKTSTVSLDPSATIILTSLVKNDSLHWKAPHGNWTIIAFWSKPSGEKGMTASPEQGPVVDHFFSAKVLKNYLHLFGERTGLQPYFGNPMRAVFNDSYEFAVDRHYSLDFITWFKKHRGYDITPWLPAVMQKGYNYASFKRPHTDPDFSFSSQDWRIKYDYDLSLSELLGEHFFKTSKNWMEPQGLLHRTQAYGLNMDMMAEAGLASIPEAENMLGPEANLKIISSGAHLYNRPIVSAESVVFINRAYTTTPQKIKLAVDKLFTAGVNQVIYHGVPYRYTPEQLGPEGWYPFSSPMIAQLNFSSNLGEGNIFWKHQKEVNDYITRTQYALRSGKPHADVLIYFPFMDVDGMPDNPEEMMTRGYIEGVEGPLPLSKEPTNEAKERWAQKVYPIINQLEASGISWDWVNDISIQQAQLSGNKQINIRGNLYQALILANDSIIQLATAAHISQLASKGMNLLAAGTLPHRQPSYLNWQENDRLTTKFIAAALKGKNSKYIGQEYDLTNWIKALHPSVRFSGQFQFTRQLQRDMTDGSRIQFIWNKTDQWQTLSLVLDKQYKTSYWINPETGTGIKNMAAAITCQMPPYGSIILFAATKAKAADFPLPAFVPISDKMTELLSLKEWSINADSIEIANSPLFDWRTNDQLRYSSAEGVYTSSFQWNNTEPGHFYLDMGKVFFTAEVYINGHAAGKRIFAPYMLDISSFLVQGSNKIEIHVTTGPLNGFIGKAKQGDPHYKQFKNKDDQLMAAGLLGPVLIKKGE